jgi:hypothetical protein
VRAEVLILTVFDNGKNGSFAEEAVTFFSRGTCTPASRDRSGIRRGLFVRCDIFGEQAGLSVGVIFYLPSAYKFILWLDMQVSSCLQGIFTLEEKNAGPACGHYIRNDRKVPNMYQYFLSVQFAECRRR